MQQDASECEKLLLVHRGALLPRLDVPEPLDQLPEWAQVLGNFNPLFHCVQLVRDAVFGFVGWADVGHLAFLIGAAGL